MIKEFIAFIKLANSDGDVKEQEMLFRGTRIDFIVHLGNLFYYPCDVVGYDWFDVNIEEVDIDFYYGMGVGELHLTEAS